MVNPWDQTVVQEQPSVLHHRTMGKDFAELLRVLGQFGAECLGELRRAHWCSQNAKTVLGGWARTSPNVWPELAHAWRNNPTFIPAHCLRLAARLLALLPCCLCCLALALAACCLAFALAPRFSCSLCRPAALLARCFAAFLPQRGPRDVLKCV